MTYENIVLVDFCDTVVKFQTFDPFIKRILYGERRKMYYLSSFYPVRVLFYLIQKIIERFGVETSAYKRFIVCLLKGISKDAIDIYANDYVEVVLENNLIPITARLLDQFKKDNYRIILLSGGCKSYLDIFAKKHGIEDVIATEIKFQNGKAVGRYSGIDCIGNNKVKMLKAYLGVSTLESSSFAAGLTDSYSDMPMLELCKRKIIISKEKRQIWVTENMEEHIWES